MFNSHDTAYSPLELLGNWIARGGAALHPLAASTAAAPAHLTFFVVVVYNDLPAALRAAETIGRLGRRFRGRIEQRLLPVPLDQLADPARFDHLLFDARPADLIIVSFNGTGDFPPTLKQWIEGCFAQQSAGVAPMVALLSADEPEGAVDSPRHQYMRNVTRTAGLDFVAPRAGTCPAAAP